MSYLAPPPGGDSPFGVIIPSAPPSATPTYVSETGATTGAELKLVGHIHAVYYLDGLGLPATTVSLGYPYLWIAGPASTVTFSADIAFTDADGVWGGAADTLLFSTSKSGSVGLSFASATVALPPLPDGDTSITVDGKFTLTSLTGPGDSPSLIKVFGVPEPNAWLSFVVGGALLGLSARQRRTKARSPLSARHV